MSDMSDNLRKDSRYELGSKVTVSMNDIIFYGAACENISFGGMRITVDDMVSPCDDGMLMLLKKYGDEVIFFKSDFTVIWNDQRSLDRYNANLGVRFKQLDENNKKALEKIISYQNQAPN